MTYACLNGQFEPGNIEKLFGNNDLEELSYRRIVDIDDMEDVFRLRYKSYLSKNYMNKSLAKKCSDYFDEMENCSIFGVYLKGKLVSSIRVHYLDLYNMGSPSFGIYGDKLLGKILDGAVFIDSTRFVVDPDIDFSTRMIPLMTMRLSVMACQFHDADYSLSLARASHGAFYSRYFKFAQWGQGRVFPGLKFPVDLFSSDVKAVQEDVLNRQPIMNSLPVERRILFGDDGHNVGSYSVHSTAKLALAAQNSAMPVTQELNQQVIAA